MSIDARFDHSAAGADDFDFVYPGAAVSLQLDSDDVTANALPHPGEYLLERQNFAPFERCSSHVVIFAPKALLHSEGVASAHGDGRSQEQRGRTAMSDSSSHEPCIARDS
ncbi:hypothetical protein A1351_20880 [Methylosinus sp. R-45379]|nr:hypothetical protein A1351_20880 [Methylosinus sp. R-45379]